MVSEKEIKSELPRTLAEFMIWESNDGYKYEWNDGELIKFSGMNKKQVKIYDILNTIFIENSKKSACKRVSSENSEINSKQT